ncbi:glycosyltransferase [Arthrobacter sp. H35-D1]|uniref:glycosyltransferase n=1 Tax=Arthrobacter sp. H35-D1 TaxID=3046202 RepID=UPI0024B91D0C|nr:glycosyltransferase [Arthrobacter sp. H35-D1]MDJ0312341.1 glycosyltransferase [Arthrobacter sp. H35-D1]
MTLRQKVLDAWFDRLTAVNIRLNDVTVAPSPAATILHGHYRDWFESFPRGKSTVGRIAFFGLIRQYKGVENLIAAFLELHDPALSLSVSGRPTDAALRDTLIKLADGSSDIEFTFKFLSDAELVEAVTQSELVVLPYNFMHNSGAALTALSLGRPVLVPATEVNRRLCDEVGPGWVYCFEGHIEAEDISSALNKHRSSPPREEPDLQARSWERAGAAHLRVFENACRLRKSTGAGAESLLVTESEPVGGS